MEVEELRHGAGRSVLPILSSHHNDEDMVAAWLPKTIQHHGGKVLRGFWADC